MRGKSHCQLGSFLAATYFPHIPAVYRRAFLLGCIEPDRNFATYFKGSIRAQWLRGHNFENAKRYMARIASSQNVKANGSWMTRSLFGCIAGCFRSQRPAALPGTVCKIPAHPGCRSRRFR